MNIIERHEQISTGVARVKGIVNRSPYPRFQYAAEHHLQVCTQALRDAIIQSDVETLERLFEISEKELHRAEEAATASAALQRKIVAECSVIDTAFCV